MYDVFIKSDIKKSEIRNFVNPAAKQKFSFRCVALFNALLNTEQEVQVSDTTKMSKEQKVCNKIIHQEIVHQK